MEQAHSAHGSGNGAEAHQLSEEGKRHQALAKQYNKQASDYIFRENNSVGRVPSDTIDLHGQFVEEAEEILEARIRQARAENQDHLHVIVGKGNHSPDHIQKIKPRVEQVCQELGLQYATEPNAGRMYINLTGGQAQMPPAHTWGGQGYAQGGGSYPSQQGPYASQNQQGGTYAHPEDQYPAQQGGYVQQQQGGYVQQQQPQYQQGYPGQPQTQFQQEQQEEQKDPLMACLKSCCSVM